MLDASPYGRKMMAKEVEILDDEMLSRYDKIHGQDGLCFALVEIFNVMAELRLKAEYGDYLAYTCTALRGGGMNDMIWKIEKLDWQAVGARKSRRDHTSRKETPPPRSYPIALP